MGSKERRERERQERINSILDAAESVLGEHGVEAATMQQIAEAAEFTKPTIYIYFQNKDDLLHGVICRGMDLLISRFEGLPGSGASAFQKLRALRDIYMQFFSHYPHYFTIMHHEKEANLDQGARPSPNFIRSDDQTRHLFTLLSQTVEEGIRDGSIRSDVDPLNTSIAFWAHCAGLFQLLNNKGDMLSSLFKRDPDEMLTCAQSLFDAGLQKESD